MDNKIDTEIYPINFGLFNINFCLFSGKKSNVICQLFYMYEIDKFIRILILEDRCNGIDKNNDLYIISFNDEKKCIVPIQYKLVNKIINQIVKCKIKNVSNSLKHVNVDRYVKKGFTKIGKIHLLISDEFDSTKVFDTSASFCDNVNVKPLTLCYYSTSGIDLNVVFSVDNTVIDRSYASTHMLNEITTKFNGEIVGTYIIHDIDCEDDKVYFNGSIYESVILKSNESNKLKAEKIDGLELIEFMLHLSGVNNCEIITSQQRIESTKWYNIIMPIKNLKLEYEFSFGNVRFINIDNSEVEEFHKFINNTEDIGCYAKIYVNSRNIYDAYDSGKKQLQQTLDFVVNIARDFSFLSYHSINSDVKTKNIDFIFSIPNLYDWCYIENSFLKQKLIFNSRILMRNKKLNLNESTISILTSNSNNELLLMQNEIVSNKAKRSLLSALKWIRKAWDSDDEEDRIIYSITSLEFILSSEVSFRIIPEDLSQDIKKDIKIILKEKIEDMESMNKVYNKVCNAFVDSSFHTKLNNLIDRLSIPIRKEDLDRICSARKLRNEIIHGGGCEMVSLRDIYCLCESISRILFYKMKEVAMNADDGNM